MTKLTVCYWPLPMQQWNIPHSSCQRPKRSGKNGSADPKFDRLKLTEQRIKDIAADIRSMASLPSPLGRILAEQVRPNGMKLTKVNVPFGVIGYHLRSSPQHSLRRTLCFKVEIACLLKGGSDAELFPTKPL